MWYRYVMSTELNGFDAQEALLAYFRKLLAQNPDWVWTHTGSIPLRDGFVNQWHASIPVGDLTLELDGICLVQIADGKIYSNQVYFDRSPLIAAVRALKGQ